MVWLDTCCGTGVTRAEVRRRKLIETARSLFIEHGFHATGIAQIARESGIAVGQIYRDFSSKEDIVAALVEEDCAQFMEVAALETAITDRDSIRARAWLHHLVTADDDVEDERLFAEIVAESSRNTRIAAIFSGLQDRLRGNILAALAIIAPGGGGARDDELTDLIMTLSLGMLHHRVIRPSLETPPLVTALQRIIDECVDRLADDRGR